MQKLNPISKSLVLLSICILITESCQDKATGPDLENGQYLDVPTEFETIQAAINSSESGDTILVQPGIYIENINFNAKNIVVGSLLMTTGDTSYISRTVLDGGRSGRVISFENGEDSTAYLIGFTITNGETEDFTCQAININGSGPNLLDLIVEGNGGTWGGSIIGIGDGANPILRRVIVKDNYGGYSGGAISIYYESEPILENVIITGTRTYEGGFGGMIVMSGSSVVIRNVEIRNNKTGGDFGIIQYDGLSIGNSDVFMENVIICCEGSGGLIGLNANITMINVVSADFSCEFGGIYCTDSNLEVINSIIKDDVGLVSSTITLSYSDILGGTSALKAWRSDIQGLYIDYFDPPIPDTLGTSTINWLNGNIDADPSFVSGGYQLQVGSSCIDAGHPDSEYNDPDGTRNDMGAFGGPRGDNWYYKIP